MAQPDRLTPTLLTLPGEKAEAPSTKPTSLDSLAAIAQKKTHSITITYRMDPERHLALKRAAVENGISIQLIIDHALKQIGI